MLKKDKLCGAIVYYDGILLKYFFIGNLLDFMLLLKVSKMMLVCAWQ